ncbi:MAG: amino acid ABC transporter permease [Spirochaetota bacterium]
MIARKAKLRFLDLLIICVCAGIAAYIIYRIKVRLSYNWNWQIIPRYLLRREPETNRLVANYLLLGLFTTIKLSIWSTILAVIIGTIMGLFRTAKNLFLRMVGTTYVELIRNLPALVLVFIFYFFISDQIMPLIGIDGFIRSRIGVSKEILELLFAPTALFTQFVSGIITIAVFEGAFITEIVRAGIESIERGQREAAYALGLSWFDQMRFVILPQATKRILPPLANQFVSTVKDSAIVSAISIQELTFEGLQLSTSTHLIFEVWISVTLMYLILTLSLSVAVNRLEIRLRRSD